MIVIKTRMKRIPDTCKRCIYKASLGTWGNVDRCCTALGDNRVLPDLVYDKNRNNYCYPSRPNWCPLTEIK